MTTQWLKWALKKYAPDILTGTSVGGVFLTGWLGVEAGMTANKRLKAAQKSKFIEKEVYFDNEPKTLRIDKPLTQKEKFDCTWKCYIPPLASAIATSASMIGAHRMHLHNEAVLAAAAAFASKNYGALESKARALLDPEKFKEIQESISNDETNEIPPWLPQPKDGETLYYEPISEQYFCATPQAMLYAQLHANKTLQEYWGVTLNDYLNVLPGCHRIPEGSQIGWYQGTDGWQEIWDQCCNDGIFIDMEFIDTQEGAKRIWYNIPPSPPDEDWEPFK